ncbi:hypothetical protein LTS18_008083 [Coniosporium uncinatum]|uniref:Uncharacterized protein n=1 Tax=Coniosporium uncinatum TaxID=93489 RepID=A0ACC3DNT0_9PEZI|nr:hypothetical protein LTS18_008083 [Coniosporium uncinatum]
MLFSTVFTLLQLIVVALAAPLPVAVPTEANYEFSVATVDRLRAEGVSERDILTRLHSQHPTPSLAYGSLEVRSTGFLDQDLAAREPDDQNDEQTKAKLLKFVHDFLATGQRTPSKRDVRGRQQMEVNAYEGKEDEVRRPVWRWAVGGKDA